MFYQVLDRVMVAMYGFGSAVGKCLVLMLALAASAGLGGCTAHDWVHAAGSILQARDAYDKQARGDSIARANSAAAQAGR
jgi:hypothetical protein